MFKHMTTFVLGILVALVPFSGFPRSWRTFFFVAFGVLIAFFSYLARREMLRNTGGLATKKLSVSSEHEVESADMPVQEVVARPQFAPRQVQEVRAPRPLKIFAAERRQQMAAATNARPAFYSSYSKHSYNFDEQEKDSHFAETNPEPVEEELNVYIAPVVSSISQVSPGRKFLPEAFEFQQNDDDVIQTTAAISEIEVFSDENASFEELVVPKTKKIAAPRKKKLATIVPLSVATPVAAPKRKAVAVKVSKPQTKVAAKNIEKAPAKSVSKTTAVKKVKTRAKSSGGGIDITNEY